MMSFLKDTFRRIRKAQAEIDEEDRLDMEMADEPDSIEEDTERFWERLKMHRRLIRNHRIIMVGVVCLLLIAGLLVCYLHVGTQYSVLSEEELSDINGTNYAELGDYLLKYSSDGVTCLSGTGNVMWNSTFSMQSPMIDICDTTVVVADKKGSDIYIYNESGLLGSFETSLPIEKVRVAKQGVVAAVLNDGDVTWINFYDTQGNEIVKNKTSLSDSGYPLDLDVSPDGMKMMVSYLRVTQGVMNTRICYYNFDEVGQSEINNLVTSEDYENVVVPEVRFLDDATSVAFLNDGFCVYQGKEIPQEKKRVEFEEEVLSVFYQGDKFGFIFNSDNEENKYLVKIYNSDGKQVMKTYFDLEYKQAKLQDGKLILFNEQEFAIYSMSGRKKFTATYDKAIQDIVKIDGFRKYMILSTSQMDKIRVW
jgi:hypothetical protein